MSRRDRGRAALERRRFHRVRHELGAVIAAVSSAVKRYRSAGHKRSVVRGDRYGRAVFHRYAELIRRVTAADVLDIVGAVRNFRGKRRAVRVVNVARLIRFQHYSALARGRAVAAGYRNRSRRRGRFLEAERITCLAAAHVVSVQYRHIFDVLAEEARESVLLSLEPHKRTFAFYRALDHRAAVELVAVGGNAHKPRGFIART